MSEESEKTEPNGPAVKVLSRETVYNDFFKVEAVSLEHPLATGGMSEQKRYLVFERGDSAAILLWNRLADKVVLVRQFRPPTLGKTLDVGFRITPKGEPIGDGWMLEAIAGMVNEGEDPKDCVIRETAEEAGYMLDPSQVEKVATFFPSPGGASERIHVFLAEVAEDQRRAVGGGNTDRGEYVTTVEITIGEFLRRVEANEIQDGKTLVAAQVLSQRLQAILGEGKKPAPGGGRLFSFAGPDGRERRIGYRCGDILRVRGVDVWVNSENTDMEMDRFTGLSVSANIRQAGARWDDHRNVVEDTVAAALRRALGQKREIKVDIGDVLTTTAGQLGQKNQVKRIIHLASVHGVVGQGMAAQVADVERCVDNVIAATVANNTSWMCRIAPFLRWRSLLMPMIGTGQGGLVGEEAAPALVSAVIAALSRHPGERTPTVYLNPFTNQLTELVARELERRAELTEVA